jgi:hypothetical protein
MRLALSQLVIKESTWLMSSGLPFAVTSKIPSSIGMFCGESKVLQCYPHGSVIMLMPIQESLLKTGTIYGIPRVINAFRALIQAIPGPDSNEISSIRQNIREPATTDERGIDYMRNIFRADLDPFLETMDKYWPDLRTLVVTYIYGYYQSDVTIIDSITTSQLNIATLVPMDVTAEVAWHMRGLIRNGGTEEQLKMAFNTTMEICRICEVNLKNTMPKAEDVINEERLF